MMDSVPFFFFTLAHKEQLRLDVFRIGLRSRIDSAKAHGVLRLANLAFVWKLHIAPIAH